MRLGITWCAVAAVLLATAAAAAAAGRARTATLRADVAEWSIVPSTGAVPAGRVRIEVRNLGADAHRLILVRTATFAEQLPLRGSRPVARPLATTPLVRAGARAFLTVSLRRGSYLLVDDLPWHYWKGTSVAFSVR